MKLQLVIDVEYDNDASSQYEEVRALDRAAQHLADAGLLSSLDGWVEEWAHRVNVIDPHPEANTNTALEKLRQRVEFEFEHVMAVGDDMWLSTMIAPVLMMFHGGQGSAIYGVASTMFRRGGIEISVPELRRVEAAIVEMEPFKQGSEWWAAEGRTAEERREAAEALSGLIEVAAVIEMAKNTGLIGEPMNDDPAILDRVRDVLLDVFGELLGEGAERIINEATYTGAEDPGGWDEKACVVVHTESGLPSYGYYVETDRMWLQVTEKLGDLYCECYNAAVVCVYPVDGGAR